MIANVIAFEHPTLKIYNTLPMPRADLDEVLAVVFTGIKEPSDEDFKRTPVLVRRNKVKNALEWLKLNHSDYHDLKIDYAALNDYAVESVPVDVLYNQTTPEEGNVPDTAKSVFDEEDELGTESGPCPFTVHGLTADKFERMSTTERKAAALQHVSNGGSLMAVGHDPNPESLYNNPSLYPKMFPWLFPYGFGGLGQAEHKHSISKQTHLRWLLMYYDKRFQEDASFLIVAFNHQIIKQGTSGSFLLVKRNNFIKVAESIRSLNLGVLSSIAERLRNGGRVIPETEQEKRCFSLLDQIEYVGGHVQGSIASKKFQRTEVWSLISFNNSPNWFVTLSFCDNKHPLCIYLADHDIEFKPDIKGYAERQHLVTRNPVACARFFHYLVELFIKHICGWSADGPSRGLFGKPSGYYGTVEQQGRMTLHLHCLLWIDGAPPPQVIRDRLMSGDLEFQKGLIEYLESCQIGEFLTGSMEEVASRVPIAKNPRRKGIHTILVEEPSNEQVPEGYVDPTLTLPEPPPSQYCEDVGCGRDRCHELENWYERMKSTVDDLLLRSNVHKCFGRRDNDEKSKGTCKKAIPKQHATGKGCINKNGDCTARFPREIFHASEVDLKNGHINLKKLEPWLNNVTAAITWISRCNTDSTCLLSGTAVKATVGYVTDYLTKAWLKTHQIFSSMYDVFNRNSDVLNTEDKPGNNARKMVLKIVNSLSAKMEIGAPMAALYLLGNPDRYTSHSFTNFYWRNFVSFVRNEWFAQDGLFSKDEDETEDISDMGVDRVETEEHPTFESRDPRGDENVEVRKANGFYVGKSSTDDYRYRPVQLESVSLYEWVQCAIKFKISSTKLPDKSLCFFNFLPDHPLSDTHIVACDPSRQLRVVPNFLGGSLPRTDKGDREYYCCTMLTLFCPWRTGLDLKLDGQSWESVFDSYQFTPRQRELMRNFNLRYECYDAQDDYAASLKKTTGEGNDDDELDDEYDQTGINDSDDDEGIDTVDGPAMKKLALARLESVGVLNGAGWCKGNGLQTQLRDNMKLPRIFLDSSINAHSWNRYICAEKQIHWNRRFKAALMASQQSDCSGVVRNDAYVVPGSYLSKEFVPQKAEWATLINNIITEWNLNAEQQKAFRIVANHATCIASDQLLMHLGGMGGTGKSRVIKAIDAYFKARNEAYRFVLLAPTGTAAALIGGTTYHSFLSFKRGGETSGDIGDLVERLSLVGYIFLDEVSMVSCFQMCQISARCSDILGEYEKPFGGLNVILCGDFAQLPPVGGLALYNRGVSVIQTTKQTDWDQQNTIGRSIWLQFTCVVILKENMRQLGADEKEIAFRTALENLRYHACTPEDIALICSRIASPGSGLSIDEGPFRNVAIITTGNQEKDFFNDANSVRFALEHGQQLYQFHSIDSVSGKEPKRKKDRYRPRVYANIKKLTDAHRADLWNQPPHTSDQIPGTLKLCLGMPILIRYNIATDLCITRGQEGRIVGWTRKRHPGYTNRYCLDVLYVELLNPPHDVKLRDLPKNVVPITPISEPVEARMKNDHYINLSRLQIPILPNFAMTDYSSQGKTREYNVVDLANATKFQAAYTALSRGTSLAGTIVMRNFADKLLNDDLDGGLRQEYRELNYMDIITDLRYKGQLPEGIIQPTRWATMARYRRWKPLTDDGSWHAELRKPSAYDREWSEPINESIVPVKESLKRKRESQRDQEFSPKKKKSKKAHRNDTTTVAPAWDNPIGPVWDGKDYSCAFDAWLFLLHWLWVEQRAIWSASLSESSDALSDLSCRFREMGRLDPENEITKVRNEWRSSLRALYPGEYGTKGIEMIKLSRHVLGDMRYFDTVATQCDKCNVQEERTDLEMIPMTPFIMVEKEPSIQALVSTRHRKLKTCELCGGDIRMRQEYDDVICFEMIDKSNLLLNMRLDVGHNGQYRLFGVIYHGDFHFISRILTKEGKVYAHDGMDGAYSVFQGDFGSQPSTGPDLMRCNSKNASFAVYIRDDTDGFGSSDEDLAMNE